MLRSGLESFSLSSGRALPYLCGNQSRDIPFPPDSIGIRKWASKVYHISPRLTLISRYFSNRGSKLRPENSYRETSEQWETIDANRIAICPFITILRRSEEGEKFFLFPPCVWFLPRHYSTQEYLPICMMFLLVPGTIFADSPLISVEFRARRETSALRV